MLACIFAENRNSTASDRRPIIVRSGRVMKILIKGKVKTVSLDRVKPAHFVCEPATGTATQRKTQSKTTNAKTTEIIRDSRKDQIRSDRTRVKSKTNTQTQSAAAKIGKNLATQHQAHRVNLPKQFTSYLAPHSRTWRVMTSTAGPATRTPIIIICKYEFAGPGKIKLNM